MAIDKDIIDQSIGQHPAKKIEFDTLYSSLLNRVEDRYISHKINGDLELFNYTPSAVYDQKWDIYTLMSRGLILEPKKKRVVATPFPKFFNYGEVQIWGADKLCGETVALEKLDGSLGIVYYFSGQWHCATRGSFDSPQAVWGESWLNNNVNISALNQGCTYLFEIIYEDNRIVIPYSYEGMVLLSAYDEEGYEYSYENLEKLAVRLSVKKADCFPFTNINDFVERSDSIGADDEGWVIRFPNGHRVKIKGLEYCRLHQLFSNVTPLGVWNVLLNNDNLASIRKELPEEHLRDFDKILQLITNRLNSLIGEITTILEDTRHLSDKDIGIAFKNKVWENGVEVTNIERKFLFSARKRSVLTDVSDKQIAHESLLKYIKPKGNILEGYEPSKAINRFQQEQF